MLKYHLYAEDSENRLNNVTHAAPALEVRHDHLMVMPGNDANNNESILY